MKSSENEFREQIRGRIKQPVNGIQEIMRSIHVFEQACGKLLACQADQTQWVMDLEKRERRQDGFKQRVKWQLETQSWTDLIVTMLTIALYKLKGLTMGLVGNRPIISTELRNLFAQTQQHLEMVVFRWITVQIEMFIQSHSYVHYQSHEMLGRLYEQSIYFTLMQTKELFSLIDQIKLLTGEETPSSAIANETSEHRLVCFRYLLQLEEKCQRGWRDPLTAKPILLMIKNIKEKLMSDKAKAPPPVVLPPDPWIGWEVSRPKKRNGKK